MRYNILVMAKQMSCLVEQMLELAKADAIQSETVFSQVDLSRLISDAILPFEPVSAWNCTLATATVLYRNESKFTPLLYVTYFNPLQISSNFFCDF